MKTANETRVMANGIGNLLVHPNVRRVTVEFANGLWCAENYDETGRRISVEWIEKNGMCPWR